MSTHFCEFSFFFFFNRSLSCSIHPSHFQIRFAGVPACNVQYRTFVTHHFQFNFPLCQCFIFRRKLRNMPHKRLSYSGANWFTCFIFRMKTPEYETREPIRLSIFVFEWRRYCRLFFPFFFFHPVVRSVSDFRNSRRVQIVTQSSRFPPSFGDCQCCTL